MKKPRISAKLKHTLIGWISIVLAAQFLFQPVSACAGSMQPDVTWFLTPPFIAFGIIVILRTRKAPGNRWFLIPFALVTLIGCIQMAGMKDYFDRNAESLTSYEGLPDGRWRVTAPWLPFGRVVDAVGPKPQKTFNRN
ncbi:MAG: hypothetical protein ABL949_06880 [Fimbriimonadaceae bacterium]